MTTPTDGADHLAIVRAHGRPTAVAAQLVGVDADGGTWQVVDEAGESTVRIAWRAGRAGSPGEVQAAVAALHRVAVVSELASLAMGEHGMLRYAGPIDGVTGPAG